MEFSSPSRVSLDIVSILMWSSWQGGSHCMKKEWYPVSSSSRISWSSPAWYRLNVPDFFEWNPANLFAAWMCSFSDTILALGVPFLSSKGFLKETSFCLSLPGIFPFCPPRSFTLGVVCGVLLNGFFSPCLGVCPWLFLEGCKVLSRMLIPPIVSP